MMNDIQQAKEVCTLLDKLIESGNESSGQYNNQLAEIIDFVEKNKINDLYLFNKLSYFIYKRDRSGSELLFKYSISALRLKVSNDAIEYAARSIFYFIRKRDVHFVNHCVEVLKSINYNEGEQCYIDFIIGCVSYSRGNYGDYIGKLKAFNKSTLNTYYKIPASTSNTSLYVDEKINPLTFRDKCNSLENINIIFCLSCDSSYFFKYFSYIADSIAKTQNLPLISISVLIDRQNEGQKPSILRELENYSSSFRIDVNFIQSDSVNIKSKSSLIRYLDAFCYSECGLPMVVCDIDAVLIRDALKLGESIPKGEVGLRCRFDTTCPWEVFTAGFSYFPSHLNSVRFLEIFSKYAMSILDNNKEQWWIDQNCIEASVRHLTLKNNGNLIFDIMPLLDDYIFLPTGLNKKNIPAFISNNLNKDIA